MTRDSEALQRREPAGPDLPVADGHGGGMGAAHGWGREYRDPDTIEPRRLWRSLVRRKWQILTVAAFALVPTAVVTLLMEPEYVSAALVEIEPEPMQVLPFREIDLPSLTPNYEMFMKSQEQLLRGPTLIARVTTRLETAPDAETLRSEVPRLGNRYSVQRLENTQIFSLGYSAPDPVVAARVSNIFAEEYIKRHYESRQQTREKAREFLQRELEELERRVQESERNLVAYAQTHRLPALDQPGQGLAPQKLSELNQELTRAEIEIFAARSRFDSMRRASIEDFPEKLVSGVISGLVARLTQLENDLTNLRATFGENWPSVVQKRGEIRLVRAQIDREKSAALQQAREQAALELATAENRRQLVASSLAGQQAQVNTLESASIQYNILRREVETNRKMYEGLLERLRQTSVVSGVELGGFRVVEAARPAGAPNGPRLWWNLLLASLTGLALGVCIALVRDYWDTAVSTVEEVEHLGVLPVLGVLPQVRQSKIRGLLARRARIAATGLADEASQAAALDVPRPPSTANALSADPVIRESVRGICASILLSQSSHPPRVLLVTSCVPAEGKSTIVAELGLALADSGARTLLVDCDMRRPSLGQRFGVNGDGGLTLFLAGLVDPTPAIHATDNANLFVVAVGPSSPNPPALLNSDRLRTFLQQMTSQFRFVILDAPPVLPIADARMLAPMAEGVILVVRAGYASNDLVRRVCGMLRSTGANVIGAVFNGAETATASGSGYRHYDDYYGS